MNKFLGLDLGTNSIGWCLRNTQLSDNQIEKVGVITFNKGVGTSKTGEYSYAAERTKKRSTRRLYQARKYRLWATLEILINEEYCPLSLENLNKWRHYNKETTRNGSSGRAYPVDDKDFEQWIKLDFDGDGSPDYKSPYQLRRQLAEERLDFTQSINKYKLGRALYHIAQRRGFKSSRKGTENVKETAEIVDVDLQYSEKKRNRVIQDLFEKYPNTTTIGSLFAQLEDDGIRIREDVAQFAIRENYKDEIYRIFQEQEISLSSDFFRRIVESAPNKNDGAIFYKRPLRSQKGLVGLCTLEQSVRIDPKTNKPIQVGKYRAPISHPCFELFRAWQFVNSIKYYDDASPSKKPLDLKLKHEIINEKFFRKSKAYFPFSEIEDFIRKKGYNWKLNYKPKTTVTGCPVSARLKEIFGSKYLETRIPKPPSSTSSKSSYYDINDIWHVLFSFEDQDSVNDFALNKLHLNTDQTKQFIYAWNAMPVGYSMLSINAINKINRFLFKGLIYTEAVLLANIPSIVGEENWREHESHILDNINNIVQENRFQKEIVMITNNLVAKYKNLDQKFGYKNADYKLDEADFQDIFDAILSYYGDHGWNEKDKVEQDIIYNSIKDCYQAFFRSTGLIRVDISSKRHFQVSTNSRIFYKSDSGYYRHPKLKDTLASFIGDYLKITPEKLGKIYHPSDISTYPSALPDETGHIKMGSPKTGSFKNPMAMRTLQELKKLLNYLINTNQIDSDTRIVVEVARQLNDMNKRWAIETWQRHREAENIEFANAIAELAKQEGVAADENSEYDINKMRLWYEQNEEESIPDVSDTRREVKGIRWSENKKQSYKGIVSAKTMVDKYRLWKEQKCTCIYTGKVIGISDLFNPNVIDIEHTIPRSISFDNSLANKTVAYMDFNRTVKKNNIPSQLSEPLYRTVLSNIKPWEDKVERIKQQVDFWRFKTKKSQDKESKDEAIKQRHLWQMELEYWKGKVDRFKMTSVTSGFVNSQLVDTQLISIYAAHYLKTYFERVDVQKGEITSVFSKIFQIQPENTLKDRNKHSHHAQDAAILTLIPHAAKRDDILRNYYESLERGVKFTTKPYPGFKREYISNIQNTVLINTNNNIQFLSKAKKVVRKRGTAQYITGTDRTMIATGDSVRGQLHLETFYGSIKPAKLNEHGKLIRNENGKIIQEEQLKFTLRVPFQYKSKPEIAGFKTWEEISKKVVDEALKKQIKKQIDDAGGVKEAFEKGFFMYDRKGNKANSSKIRHVRTWASVSEPLLVKKHTYLSTKEYKQHYYSANATNAYFAIYEINGRKHYDFRNLMDVAKALKLEAIISERDLFPASIVVKKGKTDIELPLKCILKPGLRVIFVKEAEKREDLTHKDIFNRLYVYITFEKDRRLNFKFHMEARNTIEEVYNESEINWDKPSPTLRFGYAKYDFLIENEDFLINADGTIAWIDGA